MKISFVYKLEDTNWNDGLKKALEVLEEKHEIRYHNGTYTNYFCDVAIAWGAFGSWAEKLVSQLPFRKAICVAGGPMDNPRVHDYDIVFVETKWQQELFRKIGVDSKIAFGTNTDIFYDMGLERPIDYLSVGAYAKWKRHEIFKELRGRKLAVGYMQPNGHEKECYEQLLGDSVVLPQVSPEALAWLYNQSKTVSVTSTVMGGGERTVLEALACGCRVEVANDNPKLLQLLKSSRTRVPNYIDYANALSGELNKL